MTWIGHSHRLQGNVRTQLGFRKVQEVTIPLGFGLGPINATTVAPLAPLTDIYFGASFTTFLLDPNRAIDITPAAKRQKSCSLGIDVGSRQTCEQVVFLAGGLELVSSNVATVDDHPEAQAWVAEGHQGYMLTFTEGNKLWEFQNGTECRVYHTELLGLTAGAFRICVKNAASNVIQARKFYSFDPPSAVCNPDILRHRYYQLPILRSIRRRLP